MEVNRSSPLGHNYFNITFCGIPHLALMIPTEPPADWDEYRSSLGTMWMFPGSNKHKHCYHLMHDSREAQEIMRNWLNLGHTHQKLNSYKHKTDQDARSKRRRRIKCETKGRCFLDDGPGLPTNLWYTILLAIGKHFETWRPADASCHHRNDQNHLASPLEYQNLIYVHPQHDPRSLNWHRHSEQSSQGSQSSNDCIIQNKLKAGVWTHYDIPTLVVGGKIEWNNPQFGFCERMRIVYFRALLDVLFHHSPIKRNVAEQVVEQMMPTNRERLYTGYDYSNDSLVYWQSRLDKKVYGARTANSRGESDESRENREDQIPMLLPSGANRCPMVTPTWLSDESSAGKVIV